MFIKIHNSYRSVVAICDSEILGKEFQEGKRILHVRENFYKGQEVKEKELLQILQFQMHDDATFNIVGEKSIQIAIKAGIITKENVAYVQNIPFALTLI